jgi:MFS family permease
LIGISGFFIIKEPAVAPSEENYIKGIIYGFRPKTVKENKKLYLYLVAFIFFNISIQIFMPYLIIYYEKTLKMDDYVLIMAPAIIIASVVTALWGRVYDQKGFCFSGALSVAMLFGGYGVLYFTTQTIPVFIGSLLMMSGYLAGMAVFGAVLRDNTPEGKAGRIQGVRIFSQVLIPGVVGPYIGKALLADADVIVNNDGTTSFLPDRSIFLGAAIAIIFVLPVFFISVKKRRGQNE